MISKYTIETEQHSCGWTAYALDRHNMPIVQSSSQRTRDAAIQDLQGFVHYCNVLEALRGDMELFRHIQPHIHRADLVDEIEQRIQEIVKLTED